jgi:ferrous iron transport protein B
MELPPLRRPRLGQILVRSLVERTFQVALRALKVAAPVGALLYILGSCGLMQPMATMLDPAGRLLGMNGVILLAFVLSLPANELLIPVILMTLTGAASLLGTQAMGEGLLLGGMTWQNALCAMVFTVFHWPCGTTVLTVYKETGKLRYTIGAVLLPTLVGILLCMLLNLLGYQS